MLVEIHAVRRLIERALLLAEKHRDLDEMAEIAGHLILAKMALNEFEMTIYERKEH